MLHLHVLTFGTNGKVWGNSRTCRAPSSSGSPRETPGASLKFSVLNVLVIPSSLSYQFVLHQKSFGIIKSVIEILNSHKLQL